MTSLSKQNSPAPAPRYRRILLKLSGETLQSRDKTLSIDPDVIHGIAIRIKNIADMGVQVSLVVGGGNIFRGLSGQSRGIDRTSGDHMGMLATLINGVALQNGLEHAGLQTRLMSALDMHKVAEPFILRRALRHLEKGRILIFAGGTGNPYFSTDTAAALRASEIGADVLLKATKVDGVYSADPLHDPHARRYTTLTYAEALRKSLKIMDASAFSLCRENRIPIIVFDFFADNSIEGVVQGGGIGTRVCEESDST